MLSKPEMTHKLLEMVDMLCKTSVALDGFGSSL